MRYRILFGLIGIVAANARLRAETTTCTARVTVVPFTISASGNYCLDRNLATAATATTNAITINADYVTLDLNGFKLDGSLAAPGARKGIYSLNRKGILIRNGIVEGLRAGGVSRGHGRGACHRGPAGRSQCPRGDLGGRHGVVVLAVQVSSTLPPTLDTSVEGIHVAGPQARLLHNDVLDTLATGSGVARSIVLDGGSSSVIDSNRVGNAVWATGSTGIFILTGQDLLVSSNTFTTLAWGLVFDSEAFGKYRDNLTAGVSNPYSGGNDVGGNQ